MINFKKLNSIRNDFKKKFRLISFFIFLITLKICYPKIEDEHWD